MLPMVKSFLSKQILFDLYLLTYFSTCYTAELNTQTDKLALLAFKNQITHDPFNSLSNWNDSTHVCQWRGITCGIRHGRVIQIDLHSLNLTGIVSPHIGNLSFLKSINIRKNFFHGKIPQELGYLFRLREIAFTENMLQGEIPRSILNCSELVMLDLVSNGLEGNIPNEIGKLTKLVGLGLAVNSLSGSIPSSISNLTGLVRLSLSENRLSGDLPHEIGQLKQLDMFQVSANGFLTGSLPTQLFNNSNMDIFGISENQFVGEIPSNIGLTFPNVRVLLLGKNRFTGSFPSSIPNATKLQVLSVPFGRLTGSIPKNLGNLRNLEEMNVGMNELGTREGNDLGFLSSLVNCTKLQVLAFNNNSFSGVLPDSITNLSSSLNILLMGANMISGSIPTDIDKLGNLIEIGMEESLFRGPIPSSVGNLKNLQILSIFGNKFSGEIPKSLGNVSSLAEIDLHGNNLEGSIPSSLGNCMYLQKLDLSVNKLSGTIPKGVIGLSSLSGWLDLSVNNLSGPIPMEVGKLTNLGQLYLSQNKLTGELPHSIQSCESLEVLHLSGNLLQGPIPSFSDIKGMQDIDLSCNNFTGNIPEFLSNLRFLINLNLSFNDLEGEVPKEGIFRNASEVSIIGNPKLCGGMPDFHFQSCPSMGHSKNLWRHTYFKAIIISLGVGGFMIALILSALLTGRKMGSRTPVVETPLEDELWKVTFADLFKATGGFSSGNLIGTGSFGAVYRGLLREGQSEVAVKVLDLQQRGATRSFIAECEALRCIRHRNLLKILTSCSSIDFVGNEFKALVFEFMPNGSLEKWLHNNAETRHLNFMERLSIAIDISQALDYLHFHAHTPVVHCDLKPSNVLLDDNMTAHVGDFGLARILYEKNARIQSSLSTNAFKGTIGYIAPEYGMGGEVSTMGDVYSFGVLLLEMFTGKRPTSEMFMDGLSLHTFVSTAIPDGVLEVVDPKLLEDLLPHQAPNNETKQRHQSKIEECLIAIFKVGLSCSSHYPGERLDINEAVDKLQLVKDSKIFAKA